MNLEAICDFTGATNPTWHVDVYHERHDREDEPCSVEEMTHQ